MVWLDMCQVWGSWQKMGTCSRLFSPSFSHHLPSHSSLAPSPTSYLSSLPLLPTYFPSLFLVFFLTAYSRSGGSPLDITLLTLLLAPWYEAISAFCSVMWLRTEVVQVVVSLIEARIRAPARTRAPQSFSAIKLSSGTCLISWSSLVPACSKHVFAIVSALRSSPDWIPSFPSLAKSFSVSRPLLHDIPSHCFLYILFFSHVHSPAYTYKTRP